MVKSSLPSLVHRMVSRTILGTLKYSSVLIISIYAYQILHTYRLLNHRYHTKGFRWDQKNILYRALIDTTVTNFVSAGEVFLAFLRPIILQNLLQSYYPELRSLIERIQRTTSTIKKCLLWIQVLYRWYNLPNYSSVTQDTMSSSVNSLQHHRHHSTLDFPVVSELPLSHSTDTNHHQQHHRTHSVYNQTPLPSTVLTLSNQPTVYRQIPYGTDPLQTMDIYVPNHHHQQQQQQQYTSSSTSSSSESSPSTLPILIFVHGGAWAWGKAYQYSTVCYNLCTSLNSIIINIDYRAYPYGSVDDMMHDILSVVKTITIQRYNHILFPYSTVVSNETTFPPVYLCGHSAGAHLITLAMLRCAELLYLQDKEEIDASDITPSLGTFSPLFLSSTTESSSSLPLHLAQESLPYIKGIISISGIYDIADHYIHESQRIIPIIPSLGLIQYGVARISPMAPAMLGAEGFAYRSPTQIIQALYHYYQQILPKSSVETLHTPGTLPTKTMLHYLPYILMIHGYEDTTVPVESSQKFYTVYQQLRNLLLSKQSSLSSSSSVSSIEPSSFLRKADIAEIDYIEIPAMGHADMIFDLMILPSKDTSIIDNDADITLETTKKQSVDMEEQSMGSLVVSCIQKVLQH